ncbi:MAG: ribonuclease H-like domain-containing protein [Solirubrobacterales bacterium]
MAVLVLDIETAPINANVWQLWGDQSIGAAQVDHDWTILCASWKWLGERDVFVLSTRDEPSGARDDVWLCLTMQELLDRADVVVTQNGKRFDIPKIDARLLQHGIPPYSPIRHVDTREVAKRHFAFSSNKLEYLAKLAGHEKLTHGKFPGFTLWSECLRGNAEAWDEMEKYNKQDVLATEAVYLKLRPWVANHPNIAMGSGCPKCGSEDLQKRGTAVSNTGVFQRLQCQSCGGWSRERSNMLSKPEARVLLGN